MTYNIYTDGACSGNPGKGGYAFLILANENPNPLLQLAGYKKYTTNNEMELYAVVRALTHLQSNIIQARSKPIDTVYIHTDSAYVVNSVSNNWVDFWSKNNWTTKGGTDVKNKELWQKLLVQLKDKHCHVRFTKVKGHSGDSYNEMVDEAAKRAISRIPEAVE